MNQFLHFTNDHRTPIVAVLLPAGQAYTATEISRAYPGYKESRIAPEDMIEFYDTRYRTRKCMTCNSYGKIMIRMPVKDFLSGDMTQDCNPEDNDFWTIAPHHRHYIRKYLFKAECEQ